MSVLLSWEIRTRDGGGIKVMRPIVDFSGPRGGVLRQFINRVPRCRGCGAKRKFPSFKGFPQRIANKHLRTVTALCSNCCSFIEQASDDTRIIAVFISSLGREAKYYAAFQASATQGQADGDPRQKS